MTKVKGVWASAEIPVSQHCEGLDVGWPGTRVPFVATLPLWQHGWLAAVAAHRPQDVSPRATRSSVPSAGQALKAPRRCHRRLGCHRRPCLH